MKTLGVHAENRPTIKNLIVEPADFLIAGINCFTERKYDKVFSVRGIKEFQDIFGFDINSSWYGPEEVEGFFNNVPGIDATLYISSHVGYTGSAIDGIIASAIVNNSDTPVEALLTIKAGYQAKSGGALEYGVSGNRTGYTLTKGARFSTGVKTTGLITDTWIYCTSVANIKVGDTIKVGLTAGGLTYEYKVVTEVEETTGKVSFATAFSKIATALDIVDVMGIRIQVWRKDIKGIVTEVDKELGKIYCAINSLVTDYYIENVFSTSKWIDITRSATTPDTPDEDLPTDVTTVTYLTAGVDGTVPTTAAHWSRSLAKFDNMPVRLIFNPETSNSTIQSAGETYCKAREDNPKWICNIANDRTKAQLITIGNNFQRSDDVLMGVVADWVKVTDPFSSGDNAPPRIIPNVGFIAGLILRTIGTKGIHWIPVKDTPIFGIVGIDNDNLGDIGDADRTDIAEAGVNIIQYIKGKGYILRNLFTPSTSLEFRYFNAIMMREYLKVSGIDALKDDENTPNSYERIQKNKDAMISFGRGLWNKGSTGSVKTGETFGQGFDSESKPTKFEDHYLVVADMTNNTQAQINLGERHIDVYFSFAVPTGRIILGCGLWLK